MSGDTAWLGHLMTVLMAATLVGLFVTKRIGLCPTFAVYLGLSLLRARLAAWWPDRFATLQSWVLFEALLALLGLLVVLEVSGRALADQPRAHPLHRVILVTFVLSMGAYALMTVVFDETLGPGMGYPVQGLRLAAASATTALWAWAAWAPTPFDLPE